MIPMNQHTERPTEADPAELLTVSQVAREFGVSRQSVYHWIDQGLSPASSKPWGVRRIKLFRRSDIETYRSDPYRAEHRRRMGMA